MVIKPAERTAENIRKNQTALMKARVYDAATADGILQFVVDKGLLTEPEAFHYLNDVTNRLLHARGIINYASGIQLPEPVRLALRTKLRSMGLGHGIADRNTQPVRPEERVAGLPQGERLAPQQGQPGPAGSSGGGAQDVGGKGPKGSGLREEDSDPLDYGFDGLTQSEAAYLDRHSSADSIRDTVIARGQAAGVPSAKRIDRRGKGEGDGLSEDDPDPPLSFATPPERPTGSLKNALFDIQWGLSSNRWDDWNNHPDTVAKRAEVDRQRQLWGRVDFERNGVLHYRERLAEPGLTDAGRAKLTQRLARSEDKLRAARAASMAGGVDPDGEFPRSPQIPDDWQAAPGGLGESSPRIARGARLQRNALAALTSRIPRPPSPNALKGM